MVLLFILSSCGKVTTNEYEKNTYVVSGESTTDSTVYTEITPSTEMNLLQNYQKYLVKNEGELSIQDFETAFEMCERALTDYYKGVWNGTSIELDTFIDNENLKQYTQKKIQSQYDVYAQFNNKVQNIRIGAWEAEYTDELDGGFLYLKLPVEINKTVGSYGEVTEFLLRNLNGKLVIVDWYTGAKDSYDFLVRGENLTIDNPNIWNDSKWVKNLNNKQVEFSGLSR